MVVLESNEEKDCTGFRLVVFGLVWFGSFGVVVDNEEESEGNRIGEEMFNVPTLAESALGRFLLHLKLEYRQHL